jgi:hypothetical protein
MQHLRFIGKAPAFPRPITRPTRPARATGATVDVADGLTPDRWSLTRPTPATLRLAPRRRVHRRQPFGDETQI